MNKPKYMLIRAGIFWVAAFGSTFAFAQSRASLACRPSALEDAAREVKAGNSGAVRGMVDQALGCSAFAGSADSLRDRVLRAELAFRAGKLKPVTDQTLTFANNFLVVVTFSPRALKTNEEQVRLYRVLANISAPNFVSTSDAMSPAAAVFVAGSLARQKFLNPSFSLDSEKVAILVALARRPPGQRSYSYIGFSLSPPPFQNLQTAFREQIPHEFTMVTSCMHLFLDLIDLPR